MSWISRIRSVTSKILGKLASHAAPGAPLATVQPTVLVLNDPPSHDPRPRWGHGRPRHAAISTYLQGHDRASRDTLTSVLPYVEDLAKIVSRHPAPGEPAWQNAYLPGMDMAALYSLIRNRAPSRYIEVGSGNSTMVVRRAIRDGDLDTRIVSIDPMPRADVDALCDTVHRVPLEQMDLRDLEIQSDDVVFFDGSHRVFTNSDVVAFYLGVIPSLPAGVLVGIHDILWPDDYLPEWHDYWFSEQYLLGAMLISDPAWMRPVLAAHHASTDPDLAQVLEPLWSRLDLELVDRRGFAFWFEVVAGGR